MGDELAKIKDLEMYLDGALNYLIIKVKDPKTNEEKLVLRAHPRLSHKNLLDFLKMTENPEIQTDTIGGGRINHDPVKKKFHVYGDAGDYGKADHEKTAETLREQFPEYKITVSNEDQNGDYFTIDAY